MTIIAAGASEVITVTAGASILLSSERTDVARLTITTGNNAGKVVVTNHAGRKSYGPFGDGTVTLQVVSGYCAYYVSTEGANDIEQTVEYVTLDETDISGLNTAGRPVPIGTFLKDPTTGLIYGQSDGAGSYEGFGTSATDADTALVQIPFTGALTDSMVWSGPGTLMQVVLTTGLAGTIVLEDQIAASPAGTTIATLTTTTTPETFLINSGAGSAVYAGICITTAVVNVGYLVVRGN